MAKTLALSLMTSSDVLNVSSKQLVHLDYGTSQPLNFSDMDI